MDPCDPLRVADSFPHICSSQEHDSDPDHEVIMKSGFVVIAVIFLFHGCASTIEVRNDEPLNNDRVFNFNQVNSRIHGHTVKITELGGTTHMATDIIIDQDTTRYAGQQDYE